MAHFTIAGLQLELENNNNLDYIVTQIRRTMARYPFVQMVVLSELAICGAGISVAEASPSKNENKMCELAKALGIWIVPGSLYEKMGGKIYNMAPVINPAGEVVARYRKMYPFYPYEKGVEAGAEICVFDVPDVGRFGLSICYDMWFPETTRAMIFEGAEVIIHPTLTNTNDRDIECSMVRVTAAQNQCYMIDVNGAGKLAYGRTMIAGPEGDVIHAASSTEEIVVVEVDLERVRRVRERGLMGLAQPLKSYRDAGHVFPQEDKSKKSSYLEQLGQLQLPVRGE